MKAIYILILCILTYRCDAQPSDASQLFGEWKFIELRDDKGRAKAIIPIKKFGKHATEIVNRDSYILNADSTYTAYNPYKTSYGKWYFKPTVDEICFELRVDSSDAVFPEIKARGLVEKRKDGHYYQKAIPREILEFKDNEMIIADREYYVLLYRRVESKKQQ